MPDYEASEDVPSQARAKMLTGGGIRTLGGATKAAHEGPPIAYAQKRMEKEVAHLNEVASLLVQRLAPVMVDQPPSETAPSMPQDGSSALAMWVAGHAEAISRIRAELQEALERLEV